MKLKKKIRLYKNVWIKKVFLINNTLVNINKKMKMKFMKTLKILNY